MELLRLEMDIRKNKITTIKTHVASAFTMSSKIIIRKHPVNFCTKTFAHSLLADHNNNICNEEETN
jgi:hypothetical protein